MAPQVKLYIIHLIYEHLHALSTVCVLLTTRRRDTANTNQTHAITQILIFRLALKNNQLLKINL